LDSRGIKGLPAIRGGSYQFEVELLRDCALVVGWSGAMTLPSDFDFQGFGYGSDGKAYQGAHGVRDYGPQFGKAGDIIGALVRWISSEDEEDSDEVFVSFCLNGRKLKTAFSVKTDLVDGVVAVPLQPHICQSPFGSLLHVRLRGASEAWPLVHPVEGYGPLSQLTEAHFCPFSEAVSAASAERAAKGIDQEHLENFNVPDPHVAELYDVPSSTDMTQLAAQVATFLGFTHEVAAAEIKIRLVATGVALLACRRPAHVQRLVALTEEKSGVVDLGAWHTRQLRNATAASLDKLREWRGEDSRPQRDRTAARRLIHGHLQAQMPLSHLLEEKKKTTGKPRAVSGGA